MISGDLEYLMTSLPTLSWIDGSTDYRKTSQLLNKYAANPDEEYDLIEILNKEAKKFLPGRKFLIFKSIQWSTIHEETFQQSSNSAIKAFSRFAYNLKLELKDYRLAKKRNPENRNTKFEIINHIPQNPLAAEKHILHIYWQVLEELSIGHYADYTALVIYRLKLLLLLHWWSFDAEKGYAIFQNAVKPGRDG